jgi:hypothetical protein
LVIQETRLSGPERYWQMHGFGPGQPVNDHSSDQPRHKFGFIGSGWTQRQADAYMHSDVHHP